MGASGSVMVSKLDLQTYTSEFDSHWVPHSYGLSKLPLNTSTKWEYLYKQE